MAVWACSGALLLVLLTGASYSYPANNGFDSGSPYGSSNGADPASAGSSWEGPSSGYTDSGATAAAAKTRLQTASRKGPKYSQPDVLNRHRLDINWSGAPPSPFSSKERPSARFASSKPEALGSSYGGPPAPPQFRAGELSQAETIYENGDHESESEARGIPPPPPGVAVADGPVPNGGLPSYPGGGRVVYPYPIDYMFRMGRYPPGTLSHFTDSFEQGRNSWQDSHQIRYYYPANPRTLQAETTPTDSGAPRSNKRQSQPVKQSTGSAGYGPTSVMNGQNQPYGRVGSSRLTQPKHGSG